MEVHTISTVYGTGNSGESYAYMTYSMFNISAFPDEHFELILSVVTIISIVIISIMCIWDTIQEGCTTTRPVIAHATTGSPMGNYCVCFVLWFCTHFTGILGEVQKKTPKKGKIVATDVWPLSPQPAFEPYDHILSSTLCE